jgi:hypothetical protein
MYRRKMMLMLMMLIKRRVSEEGQVQAWSSCLALEARVARVMPSTSNKSDHHVKTRQQAGHPGHLSGIGVCASSIPTTPTVVLLENYAWQLRTPDTPRHA